MRHRIEAAVFRDGFLDIRPLEIEGPREDEVLVRIVSSGICRTDVDFLEDTGGGPMVLGHEGAGIVEATGRDVRGVRQGDHVVLSYQSCGECAECRKGHPAGCEHLWDLNFGFSRPDGTSAYKGARGHFFGQSSFATHTVATVRNLVRVPNDLDLPLLAPLGCGLQTGAGTIMNSLKVRKGDSVSIFGCGPVGLAAVMAARVAGAASIIGVDANPRRLECAMELGATHVIDTGREDVDSAFARIGEVDYALEITGDRAIYESAVRALRPGGTLALVAAPGRSGSLPGGRRAINVVQGDSVAQRFIPKLIELYREGKFPFDRLVTFYDFEEIGRAVDDFEKGNVIKPVLLMGGRRRD